MTGIVPGNAVADGVHLPSAGGEGRALAPHPAQGKGPRPEVRGKFIFVGDEKLYLRGVTYGTFRPNGAGDLYPERLVVGQDFARMAASGVNVVRTYTVPPLWLLDLAHERGLWVMVGLPWEQHLCILDDHDKTDAIRRRLRGEVRARAKRPAILAYAIGNEIPASVVRWHGSRTVTRFLEQLYRDVKAEDPEALVTYVNYPTTEYLDLPFLDFVAFNVYLESQERLGAYLARLQNIAGNRPLVMAEIGLDSRGNGEEAQAEVLDWQLRAAFASGCAGAFVFSWTDEWYRGGHDIDDWDFGLVRRDRQPKPALASVSSAFADVPFPADVPWPRVSVVVCSYNGASTIRECLAGLARLNYPDYEVVVVNDGSSDATAAIAGEFGFRLISTENAGLSSARNTGVAAASGEIVAFIDDDAYPDPDWLRYLAASFLRSDHAGVGGPNIPPPHDGPVAACVANAPGGPIHVLISDEIAEHIPGCNMAFRKARLEGVGGFDPQFRVAGDDVDICWRLQDQGYTLGFSPAAVVWHRRRNSIGSYLKQQIDYGRAEALLERKWPERYNVLGHLSWAGRLYGCGVTQALGWWHSRVYHGTWGSAPFQSIHQPGTGVIYSLSLMPEWYLIVAALAGLTALGTLWTPLLFTLPLLLAALGAPLVQAFVSARTAVFPARSSRPRRLLLRALIAALHLLQPAARLRGRLAYGLTPWRDAAGRALAPPRPRTAELWSETWSPPGTRLRLLERILRGGRLRVRRGGDYDPWDLEVRGGLLGSARLRQVVEEHGGGKQLARFKWWPHTSPPALWLIVLFAALATGAVFDGVWSASVVLGLVAGLLGIRLLVERAAAVAAVSAALQALAAAENLAEEDNNDSEWRKAS